MYDPVTGEGLVCVNGKCISNRNKFHIHDERATGLYDNTKTDNQQSSG